MSDQTGPGGRIAVVTVHGTNDTAPSDDGEKWFQRGSGFATALTQRLQARGVTAEIVPFRWSGKNSAQGREKAADKLADTLKSYRERFDQVHLVAHSHGGNVANEAADFVRWGRGDDKKFGHIASLITVGTPFFKRSSSAGEKFGGLAFLAVTILSGLIFSMFFLGAAYLIFTGQLHTGSGDDPQPIATDGGEITLTYAIVITILAATAIGLILMGRLAVTGTRRLLRPRAPDGAKKSVQAIWHPNDEAIAFLQKVDQLPVAPIAKGTLWEGSRTQAIIWGVRIVLIVAGLSVYQLFTQPLGEGWWRPFGNPTPDATFEGIPDSMTFSFVGTPIIFFGAYAAYRFFFGFLPEIFLRKPINKAFAGTLKSMAFGRDGDVTLSEVATASHTYPTDQIVLKGDVHERMQKNAAAAAATLIEKYRWSLLQVGTDPNAALKDMATDAMTWDSLIHTIYFDQPEVVDIIAERIAAAGAAP